MKKVALYSALLVVGLIVSQVLPARLGNAAPAFAEVVRWLTTICLAFIMIHVGYEFEVDRRNLGRYATDIWVATSAAVLPWAAAVLYFVLVLAPSPTWGSWDTWKNALVTGLFAAPTSAGVLFSMLAAAGLSATWLFKKARVLAVFDDLVVVLLMIPVQAMVSGFAWEQGLVVLAMVGMLWAGWTWLHQVKIPCSWPYVVAYAAGVVLLCEGLGAASSWLGSAAPVHLEVLLPAFALGCVIARPPGSDPHSNDAVEGHQEGPESPREQQVSSIVSGVFMVCVGLSMPSFAGEGDVSWGVIALHVLAVTVLTNLGKMLPAFCYKDEATRHERLALAWGLFPRGEVGAGVLVLSLSLGIRGTAVQVALISLSLNLVLTGTFISVVKRLLRRSAAASPPASPVAP